MITIFRNISRKPVGRPVEVTVWTRLILCLTLSGLLHAALLVPDWRSKPAASTVVGQTVRVALVEVFPEKSDAGEDGMTAAATRPPGQADPPKERHEVPVQTKNRVRSNVAEGARESAPQPQSPKTASRQPSPDIRKKVADKPDKIHAEPHSATLRSAVEKKTPDARRLDEPEPAKKVHADPDQTAAGPALVFQCVDLLCRERTDQAGSPKQPSPQHDVSQGLTTAAAEVEASNAPGGMPLPAEANFIDATPRYQSNPLPEYPYLARQRHWEGEVWLLVTVSAGGRVEDLEVAKSSGYGALDKSALNSVRRWRFSPAQKAGVPVASRVKVPVRFQLQD